MKDFTTFREDLASGRPAKKPVSSNLLKNRAKENEKAMKSGFMKMPDYARKKFDEEKEEKYKSHMMYKGDKKVMAKKKGDHDKLNKKGYDHDNPETKKIEEISAELINKVRTKRKIQHGKEFMDNHGNVSKETQRKMDRNDKLTFSAGARKIREEKKNCGCGKDPCITYGKGGKMEKGIKEENIFEISDVLKKRYLAKAGKEVSGKEHMKDYLQRQMDKSNKKTPGTFSGMNKKFVDDKVDRETLKRRKGMAQARSKLGEAYEKGRGPTGIAYAIPKGHPDAENPKTRKKYPERQTPEYKANFKSKSKKVFGEEKQKGVDGKVCWKGYKRMGTKKKGGKTVDNCVKVEDFVLDAFYDYYLAELSPQTIKSYQKKAGSQYRDLKKTTPSRQGIENAYHQGYTSDKQYDKQHSDRDKLQKRGKGLAMSKGKGIQKEQLQLMTNLDMDESISALVKRGVGKVKQAMGDAGQAYRDNDAKQKKAGKGKYYNPMSGDNIGKRYPGRLELKKG
jgi:hypothetical protein